MLNIQQSFCTSFIKALSAVVLIALTLAACGGGAGGSSSAASYTVGGTLTGLHPGQSVKIADASGQSVTLSANGSYTAVANVPGNTAYSLSVTTQPVGQICSISNASGTVASASVSNVAVTCSSTLSLLAGQVGGDGNIDGVASGAAFSRPVGVASDAAGNTYVADTNNHTIRKISLAGVVSTFAGSAGKEGSADGTGSAARFYAPHGVAVDAAGFVYVADSFNNTIRKISPVGVVSTFAGSPSVVNTTVDGTGSSARFAGPLSLALSTTGDVYVADSVGNTIRKINPEGVVSTLAGSPTIAGFADGTGTMALFNYPTGVAVDAAGVVYVADNNNHTVRKISPAGAVSTLAGSPTVADYVDGTGAGALFHAPYGVAVDAAGNAYVAEFSNHTVRKINTAGEVSTLAGNRGQPGFADGTGTVAQFLFPTGVAISATGDMLVADYGNDIIRKISPAGGVSTLAGSARLLGSADGNGSSARFSIPLGLSADAAGNVYVADTYNSTIRKINPSGTVSTLAGSAEMTGVVDDTGALARFNLPKGLAVDGAGYVYVADTNNHTIRKISPSGQVTTLAGTALARGFSDGTGTAARFKNPQRLTVDGAGNVYVADTGNHTIRKISPAGAVTTLAGTAENRGSADGTGTVARFRSPIGIAVDTAGNVYVADTDNHTIRKISPAGAVSTIAGSATAQGSADGAGNQARFSYPAGLALDDAGNLYVVDIGNHTIRKISPAGLVTTVVGTLGSVGVALGVLPTSLKDPESIAWSGGKLFITAQNGVVWLYAP